MSDNELTDAIEGALELIWLNLLEPVDPKEALSQEEVVRRYERLVVAAVKYEMGRIEAAKEGSE